MLQEAVVPASVLAVLAGPAAVEPAQHTTWPCSSGNRHTWHTGQLHPQQQHRPQARQLAAVACLPAAAARSPVVAAVVSSAHYMDRCHGHGLLDCLLPRSSHAATSQIKSLRRGGPHTRTTVSTLSQMARLASSIACRVPTRPISRSISAPDACDTLILHPVEFCISLIVSPPVEVGQRRFR